MVNRVLHHEWFPQVFLDEHQMGATTPRIFVPPYTDPHTPLAHPLQWRLNDLIGTAMALRLEQSGKSGVINSCETSASSCRRVASDASRARARLVSSTAILLNDRATAATSSPP